MSFAFIDILFLLIVLYTAVSAAFKGLIKEAFGKAAFVAGTVCALLFFRPLSPYVAAIVNNKILGFIFAFVLLFSAAFVAVKLTQHLIASLFTGEILGSLDHALGFFFGILEGSLVVWGILWVLRAQPWINVDSVLAGSVFVDLLSWGRL